MSSIELVEELELDEELTVPSSPSLVHPNIQFVADGSNAPR